MVSRLCKPQACLKRHIFYPREGSTVFLSPDNVSTRDHRRRWSRSVHSEATRTVLSFESFLPWRPRRCKPPQATCAGPLCEGSTGVQFEPSRTVSEPGRPPAARSRSGGPGSVREGEEPKPGRKVGGG